MLCVERRSDQATQKPGPDSVPPSRMQTPQSQTEARGTNTGKELPMRLSQLAEDLMDELDLSTNGEIAFVEIQAHASDPRFSDFVEWLGKNVATFAMFDQDRSGTIGVGELKQAVQKYEEVKKHKLAIASEYPEDSDGDEWL